MRLIELMLAKDRDQRYQTGEELAAVQKVFAADYCDDEEGKQYIQAAFADGSVRTIDEKIDPSATITVLKKCMRGPTRSQPKTRTARKPRRWRAPPSPSSKAM